MHLAAALSRHKAHEPNEHVEIIRLLLDCGAEIGLVNQRQETCIHYAARQGATEQLEQIINRVSVIDAQIACNVCAQVSLLWPLALSERSWIVMLICLLTFLLFCC